MRLFRYKYAPVIQGIVAAMLMLLYTQSYAQTRIFLNKGNSGASNHIPSGVDQFTVKIGETFSLDIWYDVGLRNISAISAFLTFDDTYFEIIDQRSIPGVQPFMVDEGFSVFNHTGNLVQEPNVIPGFQITTHGQLGTGQTLSGEGRFARIELKAIKATSASEVTIDRDPGQFRVTRMLFPDLTEREFGFRGSAIITVLGVNVEGIPDVVMEPGQTLNNYFDLDDFLQEEPDGSAAWLLSTFPPGTPQDSVTVAITPGTHEVNISAHPDFTGFRDFIFTANELGEMDADTMRVFVTYTPEFGEYLKNSIVFNEDEILTGVLLDTLARDRDDGAAALEWTGYSNNSNISIAVDDSVSRTFTLQGAPDYNGTGSIVFRITDPQGATDSLVVNVFVFPVNDAPVIRGIPDVHVLPGVTDSSIILQDYTKDIDSPLQVLTYLVTGEQNVSITVDPNTRLMISGRLGFIGTETIFARVFDNFPDFSSSTVDTFRVTIGPKPPKFIAPLPDTTIFSSPSTSTVQYVNIDDFIVDDDDPLSSLNISASASRLTANVDNNHLVNFVVPARMHDRENVVFTVTDPSGASARDTVRVTVLDNGRPLIYDLPDLLFIPIGGDTTINLDDFVIDSDTPVSDLTWSTSGNQEIIVSIESVQPHTATISSPNPTFTGQETVTFRVTDPTAKSDTHEMTIQPVAPGKPIVSDIPDVEITRNRPGSFDLDDYVVIFPESERANIQWSVSPSSDVKVGVSINPSTNLATFTVLDPEFKGTRQFTFTATNTANGELASDPMGVTVTFGKVPILGHFPNIEFISGDTSTTLDLDKFVFDQDTPDDSIAWTVQSRDVFPIPGHLARGEDHEFRLFASEGFIGIDEIVLAASDPEGNIVSATVRVFVKSSGTLDIMVIPNPVSADYIDIITFASDVLIGTPSVRLVIDNTSTDVAVHEIGDEFIWKADYIFDKGQTGPVKIITEAADNFGSVLKDSVEFTLGVVTKANGYRYADDNITLGIPSDYAAEDLKIMILPDERKRYYDWLMNDADYRGVLTGPVQSYYIGGGLGNAGSQGRAVISLGLDGLELDRTALEKYGIYRISPPSDDVFFVSNSMTHDGQTFYAEVDRNGLYFLAEDIHAPEIAEVRQNDPAKMKFTVKISEYESGLQSVRTEIDGRTYRNSVATVRDGVYEIAVEGFDQTGPFVLSLSAVDKAGNASQEAVRTFNRTVELKPATYSLVQNYPNPFNPTTQITYQLPGSDFISLVIYNSLGQKVRTLVSEEQAAGTYTVEWDSRNDNGIPVASGVYIYVLQTDQFSKMRRMVLLK